MLKYCRDQWDKNVDKLREYFISKRFCLDSYSYIDLVIAVVDFILNDDTDEMSQEWNSNNIVEIDHGEYQGTLMYMIPRNCYQPCAAEYLVAAVEYGSCSACDTLQRIQSEDDWQDQIGDLVYLCKEIVTSIKHPYGGPCVGGNDYSEIEFNSTEKEKSEGYLFCFADGYLCEITSAKNIREAFLSMIDKLGTQPHDLLEKIISSAELHDVEDFVNVFNRFDTKNIWKIYAVKGTVFEIF